MATYIKHGVTQKQAIIILPRLFDIKTLYLSGLCTLRKTSIDIALIVESPANCAVEYSTFIKTP
jgi:hypothetical protein